jgi:UDP-glucose 4-epimerase
MRVATEGGGHIGQVTAARPLRMHLSPTAPDGSLRPRAEAHIFRNDYETPNALCLRDYVYVPDLAVAYLRAPGRWLPARYDDFKFGDGNAYSVQEMIRTVQLVASRGKELRLTAPRPRDPAVLVASAARTRREFGWRQAAPTWSR